MDYLTFDKLPLDLQNRATYRNIDSGQILFQQGEATKSIYFLMEGHDSRVPLRRGRRLGSPQAVMNPLRSSARGRSSFETC